tara:strand:- start:301 stop:513 length:213 start_codon:yes stop_codon:yes gene_type:complete
MLQIVERNKNKEPVYQETLAKMLATKKTFGLPKEKGQILIFEGRIKKADCFFSCNAMLAFNIPNIKKNKL